MAVALLYPSREYSPAENPLRAAEVFYLPDEPNGLYLEGEEGAYRLYIVAAERPMSELEIR